MDNIEHDVKVLNKLLNSPIILQDYPYIKRTAVYRQGGKIEVVFFIDEETPGHTRKYFNDADDIKNLVARLAKMAGVTSLFWMYP